jgi:hypothetical protein
MKDFTLYPEALELKQLGFDEPCFGVYFNPTQELSLESEYAQRRFYQTPAPTYSQAFRWFRDNGKVAEIFSQLLPSNKYKWGFKIQGIEGVTDGFFTYEEAELACLKKLIEVANGKQ